MRLELKIDLTKEQEADIALFKRAFYNVGVKVFKFYSGGFVLSDESDIVAITNRPSMLDKKTNDGNTDSMISEEVTIKIRPFIGRVISFRRNANEPFFLELASGLFLVVAPYAKSRG
ncbi:MAG: hypothetical protein PHS46_08250 [Candidatus Omnitrophica bacterium]|nr:hypothetical protein [Candidatus Omnitrophota bacterium]